MNREGREGREGTARWNHGGHRGHGEVLDALGASRSEWDSLEPPPEALASRGSSTSQFPARCERQLTGGVPFAAFASFAVQLQFSVTSVVPPTLSPRLLGNP
jgi:hypothetical protein